jgi:hypothetical protein
MLIILFALNTTNDLAEYTSGEKKSKAEVTGSWTPCRVSSEREWIRGGGGEGRWGLILH